MEIEPRKESTAGELLLYIGDRAWWVVRLVLGHALLVGVGIAQGVITLSQGTALTTYLTMLMGFIILFGAVSELASDWLSGWRDE